MTQPTRGLGVVVNRPRSASAERAAASSRGRTSENARHLPRAYLRRFFAAFLEHRLAEIVRVWKLR